MQNPIRKRRRNDTPAASSSSSKALQYFVAVGTPIVLLQMIVVYKLMIASPGGNLSLYHHNDLKQAESGRKVEGTFNGYPIHFEDATGQSIASQVHCIGESYEPKKLIRRTGQKIDMSWQHRSCHFQFFCYDMEEKEYVLYEGPSEKDAASFPDHADVSQSYMMVNQTHHDKGLPYSVAIGGLNGKWTHNGVPRLKWYPTVRSEPPKSFYALPADVAMIPFHSLASFNPGHLVWDDFLPVYSEFSTFKHQTHYQVSLTYCNFSFVAHLWFGPSPTTWDEIYSARRWSVGIM